jgi:hypothetical protein
LWCAERTIKSTDRKPGGISFAEHVAGASNRSNLDGFGHSAAAGSPSHEIAHASNGFGEYSPDRLPKSFSNK